MESLFFNTYAVAAEVDPVVMLGQELGRGRAYEEAQDELDLSADWESQTQHACDQTQAARDAITCTKAISLPGAAIQIAEAVTRLHLLADVVPREAECYDFRQLVRSIDRLLHSALDVVDNEAGEKLADTVDATFGERRISPWLGRFVPPAADPGTDPLLDLIERFNACWEAYVAAADDIADDFYAKEVGPLLKQMTDACPSATTHAGAMAAIGLSLRGDSGPGGIAFLPKDALVKGALAFLEGGANV